MVVECKVHITGSNNRFIREHALGFGGVRLVVLEEGNQVFEIESSGLILCCWSCWTHWGYASGCTGVLHQWAGAGMYLWGYRISQGHPLVKVKQECTAIRDEYSSNISMLVLHPSERLCSGAPSNNTILKLWWHSQEVEAFVSVYGCRGSGPWSPTIVLIQYVDYTSVSNSPHVFHRIVHALRGLANAQQEVQAGT